MNIICKSRLAGASTSILGVLVAFSMLAFSRGFEMENVIKLFNDFSETPGAIAASIILILNGLWMGAILYRKYAFHTFRSVVSGIIAAWLSIALAVCIGYLTHILYEGEYNEWWIGMAVYTLYSLILGGIPAGFLGGSLGYFLSREWKRNN